MFTIECLHEQGWRSEMSFQTEFKAFLHARTKCMATGRTYRVIDRESVVACLVTLDSCRQHFGAR
ncbi:MAG: hypothetical protein CMN95_06065 [Synechococcus sp. MED650]|nr:hypothetical protein [Synechococcus sp. MED650]OUW54636.1 MAG: hypothetical protein CBD48_04685 [Cyanobacteria bacterium TMED188]